VYLCLGEVAVEFRGAQLEKAEEDAEAVRGPLLIAEYDRMRRVHSRAQRQQHRLFLLKEHQRRMGGGGSCIFIEIMYFSVLA
jgi:hypothetical protein